MLSTLTLDNVVVNHAVSTLHAFVALNGPRELEEKREGLHLHLQGLGMPADVVDHLFELLVDDWEQAAPFVFIGALLGLHMAERSIELYGQD